MLINNQKIMIGQVKQKSIRKRRPMAEFNNISKVYKCFCKKKYMSYSALYLHAQLKHHLKIKNHHLQLRSIDNEQRVARQQKIIEIFQLNKAIFFSEIQNSSELAHNKKKNFKLDDKKIKNLTDQKTHPNMQKLSIQQVIQIFINQWNQNTLNILKKDLEFLFQIFQQCLNSSYYIFDNRNILLQGKYSQICNAEMIAYFFNYFTTQYLPQFRFLNIKNLDKQRLVEGKRLNILLMYFAKWLYQNGYSSLEAYIIQDNKLQDLNI